MRAYMKFIKNLWYNFQEAQVFDEESGNARNAFCVWEAQMKKINTDSENRRNAPKLKFAELVSNEVLTTLMELQTLRNAVHQKLIVWTWTITHFRLPILALMQSDMLKMSLKDSWECYTNFSMIWMYNETMLVTAGYSFLHHRTALDICPDLLLTPKTERKFYCPIKLSRVFSTSWWVHTCMALQLEDMTQS